MMVFRAMMLDSYRQLNSKKLFWITLALSGFVVLFYGSMGFDEKGMFFLFGISDSLRTDNELLVNGSPIANILYRSIFSTFIVGIWLAWIAIILALISTTTIFPDFVAGGAIDMVLSKPVSRVRLFIMKYLSSMLFVLAQVTIFCVGIFLCMGLRIGDWDWRVFLAVPVVMAVFSYLFAVNVLIGVWTRSAIAALLLTMLFWCSLWFTSQAEAIVNTIGTTFEVQNESSIEQITAIDARIENNPDDPRLTNWQFDRDQLQTEADESQKNIDDLDRWHQRVRIMQYPMPKTSETIGLLDRWLVRDTDVNLMDILQGNVKADGQGGFVGRGGGTDAEATRKMMDDYRSRSVWDIAGTSLTFEFLVLVLAGWIFVRRDY